LAATATVSSLAKAGADVKIISKNETIAEKSGQFIQSSENGSKTARPVIYLTHLTKIGNNFLSSQFSGSWLTLLTTGNSFSRPELSET
jgi:hypothetical protein